MWVGRFLLDSIEECLAKIPLVNRVYDALKQVVAVFSSSRRKDMKPVLVEYPSKDMWAIAFLTPSRLHDMTTAIPHAEGYVSVFVPTTPNPTSGYFIFVSPEKVKPLTVSVEVAIKSLISAGVVPPKG